MSVKDVGPFLLAVYGVVTILMLLRRDIIDIAQFNLHHAIVHVSAPIMCGGPIRFYRALVDDTGSDQRDAFKWLPPLTLLLLASLSPILNAGVQQWAARVGASFFLVNWTFNSRCSGWRPRWSTAADAYIIGLQFIGGHQVVYEALETLAMSPHPADLLATLLLIVGWWETLTVLMTALPWSRSTSS